MKKKLPFIRIVLSILVLMGMYQHSLCKKIIEKDTVEIFRTQYPDDYNHIQSMARCLTTLRKLGFDAHVGQGVIAGNHSTGRTLSDIAHFLPSTPDNKILGNFSCKYDRAFEGKIKEAIRKVAPYDRGVLWDTQMAKLIFPQYELAKFAYIAQRMNEAELGDHITLTQIQYPMVSMSPAAENFFYQHGIKLEDMITTQVDRATANQE